MKTSPLLKSLAVISLLSVPSFAGQDIMAAHREDNAMADADEITELRSTLAKTFVKPGTEINEETFKKVCGAVGKRVKELEEKEGITVRHASVKNRNPKNDATADERALLKRFETDRGFKGVWEDIKINGKSFRRYSRPIFVEPACLACHGEKDARPEFIKNKYPLDEAYGYQAGDLRGLISITIPAE